MGGVGGSGCGGLGRFCSHHLCSKRQGAYELLRVSKRADVPVLRPREVAPSWEA